MALLWFVILVVLVSLNKYIIQKVDGETETPKCKNDCHYNLPLCVYWFIF